MPDRKPDPPIQPYESARSDRPTSAEGTLLRSAGKHDPYAAFRFPAFRFYTSGNLISVVGRLMLMIALPVVLLSLFAGHIADRFPRKRIVLVTQALSAICSVALAFVSWQHLAIPNWVILQKANHFLFAIA